MRYVADTYNNLPPGYPLPNFIFSGCCSETSTEESSFLSFFEELIALLIGSKKDQLSIIASLVTLAAMEAAETIGNNESAFDATVKPIEGNAASSFA